MSSHACSCHTSRVPRPRWAKRSPTDGRSTGRNCSEPKRCDESSREKRLYHIFFDNNAAYDWRSNCEAKSATEKAVADTKAAQCDELGKK